MHKPPPFFMPRPLLFLPGSWERKAPLLEGKGETHAHTNTHAVLILLSACTPHPHPIAENRNGNFFPFLAACCNGRAGNWSQTPRGRPWVSHARSCMHAKEKVVSGVLERESLPLLLWQLWHCPDLSLSLSSCYLLGGVVARQLVNSPSLGPCFRLPKAPLLNLPALDSIARKST